MSRKLYFSILIILFFSGLGYYLLGGFNEPEIEIIDFTSTVLVGKGYIGRYRSSEIEEIFYQVRSEIEKNSEKIPLVIVNYPVKGEDTVRYFVGMELQSTTPEGWERYEVETSPKSIRIRFNKHNLVMPKPFKVEEMAEEYAGNNGFKLTGITVEKYISERETEIDFLLSEE